MSNSFLLGQNDSISLESNVNNSLVFSATVTLPLPTPDSFYQSVHDSVWPEAINAFSIAAGLVIGVLFIKAISKT